MEILGAKVNWNDKYDNNPELVITVKELPKEEEFCYASKPLGSGSVLYRAEHNEFVRFYYHDPRDESGFGGRTFTLKSNFGQDTEIKGRWSSRASAVNRHFRPYSVDVLFAIDGNHNHTYSGAVTLDAAIRAIKLTGNWLARVVEGPSTEVSFVPVMRRTAPKGIMSKVIDGIVDFAWEYEYPDVESIPGYKNLRHPIAKIGYRPGETRSFEDNPLTED